MLAKVKQSLTKIKQTLDNRKENAIFVFPHLQNPNYIFQRDAKFILIERITKK